MHKSYIGSRDGGGNAIVSIRYENRVEVILPARLDLRNHSPDGFEWSYGGSGPAQLALAILADATDDATAVRLYQLFKWAEVACLDKDAAWIIKADHVRRWVQMQESKTS